MLKVKLGLVETAPSPELVWKTFILNQRTNIEIQNFCSKLPRLIPMLPCCLYAKYLHQDLCKMPIGGTLSSSWFHTQTCLNRVEITCLWRDWSLRWDLTDASTLGTEI